MLFGRKKEIKSYDPSERKPVIRSSICTGEKTAGFLDLKTGRFHEIMLIRNDKDLKEFMLTYGIKDEPETIY